MKRFNQLKKYLEYLVHPSNTIPMYAGINVFALLTGVIIYFTRIPRWLSVIILILAIILSPIWIAIGRYIYYKALKPIQTKPLALRMVYFELNAYSDIVDKVLTHSHITTVIIFLLIDFFLLLLLSVK